MSPNLASPRPRPTRDGSHLSVIVGGIKDEPDDTKDTPKPTRPMRVVPPAGSATVRALIALGALLTALGFTIGKADAELRSHEQVEEADPTLDPTEVAASTTTTGGTAAQWTPSRRIVAAAYTMPAPTGRHRKPAQADGWGEWNPDTWGKATGRHRRPTPPKTVHGPVGAHQHAHTPPGAVKIHAPHAV